MSRCSTLIIVTSVIAILIGTHHDSDLLAQDPTGWRQTSSGWIYFPVTQAAAMEVEQAPTVHPVAVGLLQLFMSVGALVTFTPSEQINRYLVRYFRS